MTRASWKFGRGARKFAGRLWSDQPHSEPPPPPVEAGRPRIVILSASVGSGHVRAAAAIKAALTPMLPGALIEHYDALEFTNSAFRAAYGEGYFRAVERAPGVVGWMYDFLDHPGDAGVTGRARQAFERFNSRRLTRLLSQRPWDLVINTHFLPAALVSNLRRSGTVGYPQVTVATDFDVHAMWINGNCERFCVATPEAKINAIAGGQSAESIAVTGIPVDPVFDRPRSRNEIIRELGLSPDRPIILQLSGGFGIGPVERIHRLICDAHHDLQVITVTGKNAAARQALLDLGEHPRHVRQIIGYTDRMPDLLCATDIVVSKPGGLTTSECLASGCAMMIVGPIPGQEDRNADYLLENGCAVKINNLASLTLKLDELLGNPHRLTHMRAAALACGRPRSAFDVASVCIELLKLSDQSSASSRSASPAPAR